MEATAVEQATELPYTILRQEPREDIPGEIPDIPAPSTEPEAVKVPPTPEELLERKMHARRLHINARIRLVLTKKLECPLYSATSIHLALLECLARGTSARTLTNKEIVDFAVANALDERVVDLVGHVERDFLDDSKRKKETIDTLVFQQKHPMSMMAAKPTRDSAQTASYKAA